MRKLPRRLPSSSPSLAWVGFAVLLLAVGGGLAGLYTHRQNQENTKLRLIKSLEQEVATARARVDSAEREVASLLRSDFLLLELKKYNLPMQAVTPDRRITITETPRLVEENKAAHPSPASGRTPGAPSVMAVLGRPQP